MPEAAVASQSSEREVDALREELEKKTEVISEISASCDRKDVIQMYKFAVYGLIIFVAGLVAGFMLS